ncbi:hypothetical protein CCB80_03115 [Armatimonadetes bacterium Uphvl-Ar1]|nr:hypothetical protein CCB80_03115 [Armatimonadetes bacterium Uphvl-Ar1]
MAEKIINIKDIPAEGVESGTVIADWGGDRITVAICVNQKGERYATYIVQNDNPDYGWVDYDDEGLTTVLINLFELPLFLVLDGDLIKVKQ